MAKRNGTTKATSLSHTSIIEELKQSKDFFIRNGMNRYDNEKDNPAWDFSDMKNLTETEKTYLVAYLSHSYRVINEGLRNNTENPEIKAMVKGIDKAVAKLDTFKGTVYRGMEFDTGHYFADKKNAEAVLNYYKSNVGKDIVEKGYVSTGKVKSKIDKKFTSSMVPSFSFTIDSKTGRDVSRYNNEEKEVLFRRGTKFHVVSVKGNKIHLREV